MIQQNQTIQARRYADATKRAIDECRELQSLQKKANQKLILDSDIENRPQAAAALELMSAQNKVIESLCDCADIGASCLHSICDSNDQMSKAIEEFRILYKYRKTILFALVITMALSIGMAEDFTILKALMK